MQNSYIQQIDEENAGYPSHIREAHVNSGQVARQEDVDKQYSFAASHRDGNLDPDTHRATPRIPSMKDALRQGEAETNLYNRLGTQGQREFNNYDGREPQSYNHNGDGSSGPTFRDQNANGQIENMNINIEQNIDILQSNNAETVPNDLIVSVQNSNVGIGINHHVDIPIELQNGQEFVDDGNVNSNRPRNGARRPPFGGSASQVRRFLLNFIKYHVLSFFIALLFLFVLRWNISTVYPFIFLWLVDIYMIIAECNTENKPLVKFVEITETMLSSVTKIFIVLYLNQPSIPLTYTILPLIIFSLLKTIIPMFKKGRRHRSLELSELFVRVFLDLQLIFIALKLDGLIHLGWKEAFWSYWVLFSVMVGVTFAVTLMMLSKVCYYFCGESDRVDFRGSLWLFIFLAGTTISSCIFVIQLLDFLLTTKTVGSSAMTNLTLYGYKYLSGTMIAIISYNLCTTVYTVFYAKDIEQFFQKAQDNSNNENVVQENLPAIQPEEEKVKPKEDPLDIPKFLMRSSSTYFKRATEVEYRKQREELKNEVRLKKVSTQRSRLRTNSIDYGTDNHIFRMTSRESDIIGALTTTREQLLNALTPRSKDEYLGQDTLKSPRQDITTLEPLTSSRNRSGHSPLIASFNRSSSPFQRNFDRGIVESIPNELELSKRNANEDITFDEWNTGEEVREVNRNINMLEDYEREYGDQTSQGDFNDVSPDYTPTNSKKSQTRPSIVPKLPFTARLDPILIPKKQLFVPNEEATGSHTARSRNSADKVNLFHSFQVERQALDDLLKSIENEIQDDLSKNEIIKHNHNKNPETPDVKIEKINQCLVCFDKFPDAVFMECGHGGVCYECSLEVWKATGECFLCRNKITQVLQIDTKSLLKTPVIKVISSTQMVTYEDDADSEALEPANFIDENQNPVPLSGNHP